MSARKNALRFESVRKGEARSEIDVFEESGWTRVERCLHVNRYQQRDETGKQTGYPEEFKWDIARNTVPARASSRSGILCGLACLCSFVIG